MLGREQARKRKSGGETGSRGVGWGSTISKAPPIGREAAALSDEPGNGSSGRGSCQWSPVEWGGNGGGARGYFLACTCAWACTNHCHRVLPWASLVPRPLCSLSWAEFFTDTQGGLHRGSPISTGNAVICPRRHGTDLRISSSGERHSGTKLDRMGRAGAWHGRSGPTPERPGTTS